MSTPHLLVAAGTESSIRGALAACLRARERAGALPDDLYALVADGDDATRTAVERAGLPGDRVVYVPLSLAAVRDARTFRPEEMADGWRPEWEGLLTGAPDNGAGGLPALGRLMLRAARPAVVQHLHGFHRRITERSGRDPEVWILWSPVSGTSRGSVADLPRWVRATWPEARVHGVVVQPVGLDDLDPDRARLYQTNFIEAVRLMEHLARRPTFRVWSDETRGWVEREARLLDDVVAFDGHYGNRRLSAPGDPMRTLSGGLPAVFARVAELLAAVATGDRLAERMRSRLTDAARQRGEALLDVQRTALVAVHEATLELDEATFREALIARALARVGRGLGALAPEIGDDS